MRLEAVNEQQAAAEAVLEEAQRQLLELDVAGRTENEVRRELETANHQARSAESEVDGTRRHLESLQSELNATRGQLDDIDQQGVDLRFIVDTDPEPVRRAIDRVEHAPLVDPDDATLTLANDLERRLADLADAGTPPPAPDPEEVTAAEATVMAAREVLDQLRNPEPKSAPEWWDELSRLHAEVVDAEAAIGSRRGRAAAQRRHEEAVAAERALLERLGFASHLDALLAGSRSTSASLDPQAIPTAQDALSHAEVRLHGLYDADALATTYKRTRSDIVRMRALGAALLGVLPSDVTPERLRQLRPDPNVADELAAVLASAGSEPDGQSLVDRGRRWLAERESAAHRLGSLDAERARLTARVDALLPQIEMATSEVERTDSAARNARRRVEVLEAEMVDRHAAGLRPATRAATAAALRDHVSALEARITAAKSEAEGKQSVASKGLSAATVRFDQARRDTDDLSRRATLAARLLPERAELPDDLLSDLGSLAAALRHEYQALDDTLGSLADGVAAAAEREAELSAALSDLRALDADEPSPSTRPMPFAGSSTPSSAPATSCSTPRSASGPSRGSPSSTRCWTWPASDPSWWSTPSATSRHGPNGTNPASWSRFLPRKLHPARQPADDARRLNLLLLGRSQEGRRFPGGSSADPDPIEAGRCSRRAVARADRRVFVRGRAGRQRSGRRQARADYAARLGGPEQPHLEPPERAQHDGPHPPRAGGRRRPAGGRRPPGTCRHRRRHHRAAGVRGQWIARARSHLRRRPRRREQRPRSSASRGRRHPAAVRPRAAARG